MNIPFLSPRTLGSLRQIGRLDSRLDRPTPLDDPDDQARPKPYDPLSEIDALLAKHPAAPPAAPRRLLGRPAPPPDNEPDVEPAAAPPRSRRNPFADIDALLADVDKPAAAAPPIAPTVYTGRGARPDVRLPNEMHATRPDASRLGDLDQEAAFQQWYAPLAKANHLDPNPDDPRHFYDYRAAFRAGASPDMSGHWPSEFKKDGHPNLIVDGVNTKTGEPVARPIPSLLKGHQLPGQTATLPDIDVGPVTTMESIRRSKMPPPAPGPRVPPADPFASSMPPPARPMPPAPPPAAAPQRRGGRFGDFAETTSNPLEWAVHGLMSIAGGVTGAVAAVPSAIGETSADQDLPGHAGETHPVALPGFAGMATAKLRPAIDLAQRLASHAMMVIHGQGGDVAPISIVKATTNPPDSVSLSEGDAEIDGYRAQLGLPPLPQTSRVRGRKELLALETGRRGLDLAAKIATDPSAIAAMGVGGPAGQLLAGAFSVSGIENATKVAMDPKATQEDVAEAVLGAAIQTLPLALRPAVLKATGKVMADVVGPAAKGTIEAAKAAAARRVLAGVLSIDPPAAGRGGSGLGYGAGDVTGYRGQPFSDQIAGKNYPSDASRADVIRNLVEAIKREKDAPADEQSAARIDQLELDLRRQEAFARGTVDKPVGPDDLNIDQRHETPPIPSDLGPHAETFGPERRGETRTKDAATEQRDAEFRRLREEAAARFKQTSPAARDNEKATADRLAREPHDYSSTQVDLPPEHAKAVRDLAATIPNDALAGKGRETRPHATVLYGLHTEDADDVKKVLAGEKPITVTLGKTSTFPPSEGSDGAAVLKVDLDSPDLHRLNKKLAGALEHTNPHDYQPHITIAYIDPKAAKGYTGLDMLEGRKITIHELTFSGKDGTTVTIPLGGGAPASKPATTQVGGPAALEHQLDLSEYLTRRGWDAADVDRMTPAQRRIAFTKTKAAYGTPQGIDHAQIAKDIGLGPASTPAHPPYTAVYAFEQPDEHGNQTSRYHLRGGPEDGLGGSTVDAAKLEELGLPIPEKTAPLTKPAGSDAPRPPKAKGPVPQPDPRDTTKYGPAVLPGLHRDQRVEHTASGHTGTVLESFDGPSGSGRAAFRVKWDTGETTIVPTFGLKMLDTPKTPASKPAASQPVSPAAKPAPAPEKPWEEMTEEEQDAALMADLAADAKPKAKPHQDDAVSSELTPKGVAESIRDGVRGATDEELQYAVDNDVDGLSIAAKQELDRRDRLTRSDEDLKADSDLWFAMTHARYDVEGAKTPEARAAAEKKLRELEAENTKRGLRWHPDSRYQEDEEGLVDPEDTLTATREQQTAELAHIDALRDKIADPDNSLKGTKKEAQQLDRWKKELETATDRYEGTYHELSNNLMGFDADALKKEIEDAYAGKPKAKAEKLEKVAREPLPGPPNAGNYERKSDAMYTPEGKAARKSFQVRLAKLLNPLGGQHDRLIELTRKQSTRPTGKEKGPAEGLTPDEQIELRELQTRDKAKDHQAIIDLWDEFETWHDVNDVPMPDDWSKWQRAADDARYELQREKPFADKPLAPASRPATSQPTTYPERDAAAARAIAQESADVTDLDNADLVKLYRDAHDGVNRSQTVKGEIARLVKIRERAAHELQARGYDFAMNRFSPKKAGKSSDKSSDTHDAAARGVPYEEMTDEELRELLDIGVGDEQQKAAIELKRRQADENDGELTEAEQDRLDELTDKADEGEDLTPAEAKELAELERRADTIGQDDEEETPEQQADEKDEQTPEQAAAQKRAIAAMEQAVEFRDGPRKGAVQRLGDKARERVVKALTSRTHDVVDVKEPFPGIVTISYHPHGNRSTLMSNTVRLPNGKWPDGVTLPTKPPRDASQDVYGDRDLAPLPEGQVFDATSYAARYFNTAEDEDAIDDLRATAKVKALNKKDQSRLDALKERVKERKDEATFYHRFDTLLTSPETGWLKGEDDLQALSERDLHRLGEAAESRARLEGKAHALKAYDDPRLDAIAEENSRRHQSEPRPTIDLTSEPARKPYEERKDKRLYEHEGRLYTAFRSNGSQNGSGFTLVDGHRVVPREEYTGWIPVRTYDEYYATLRNYLPWEFGHSGAWKDLLAIDDDELIAMADSGVTRDISHGRETGVVETFAGQEYVYTGEIAKLKFATKSAPPASKPAKSQPVASEPLKAGDYAVWLKPTSGGAVQQRGLVHVLDVTGSKARIAHDNTKWNEDARGVHEATVPLTELQRTESRPAFEPPAAVSQTSETFTTPGTRLTWSTGDEWADQHEVLRTGRGISAKVHRDRKSHLEELSKHLDFIDRQPRADLERMQRIVDQSYKPPKGQRGGTTYEVVINAINNALQRLGVEKPTGKLQNPQPGPTVIPGLSEVAISMGAAADQFEPGQPITYEGKRYIVVGRDGDHLRINPETGPLGHSRLVDARKVEERTAPASQPVAGSAREQKSNAAVEAMSDAELDKMPWQWLHSQQASAGDTGPGGGEGTHEANYGRLRAAKARKEKDADESDNARVMALNPRDRAINQTLHGFASANARWAEVRRRGLSDAGLKKMLGDELGISGGRSGRDFKSDYHGGANPRFTLTFPDPTTPGEYGTPENFSGKKILTEARRVLQIPERPAPTADRPLSDATDEALHFYNTPHARGTEEGRQAAAKELTLRNAEAAAPASKPATSQPTPEQWMKDSQELLDKLKAEREARGPAPRAGTFTRAHALVEGDVKGYVIDNKNPRNHFFSGRVLVRGRIVAELDTDTQAAANTWMKAKFDEIVASEASSLRATVDPAAHKKLENYLKALGYDHVTRRKADNAVIAVVFADKANGHARRLKFTAVHGRVVSHNKSQSKTSQFADFRRDVAKFRNAQLPPTPSKVPGQFVGDDGLVREQVIENREDGSQVLSSRPVQPEPQPYSQDALQAAMHLTPEQAEATDALIAEMGVDTDAVQIVKGGTPGDGALTQEDKPRWQPGKVGGPFEKGGFWIMPEGTRAFGATPEEAQQKLRDLGFDPLLEQGPADVLGVVPPTSRPATSQPVSQTSETRVLPFTKPDVLLQVKDRVKSVDQLRAAIGDDRVDLIIEEWHDARETVSDASRSNGPRTTPREPTWPQLHVFINHQTDWDSATEGWRDALQAARLAIQPLNQDVLFDEPSYQGPKGAVEFAQDGKAIVRGLAGADVSTAIHEFFHVFRRQFLNRNVPAELRAGITDDDIDVAEAWAGAEDGWTVDAEEKIARGFERYLHDGNAPTVILAKLFKQFSEWLKAIYKKLDGSEIDIEISPAMREVYAKVVQRAYLLRTKGKVWDEKESFLAYEHEVETNGAPVDVLERFNGLVAEHPSFLRDGIETRQLQKYASEIADARATLAEPRTANEDLPEDLENPDAAEILDQADKLVGRELQRREGQGDLFQRPRPVSQTSATPTSKAPGGQWFVDQLKAADPAMSPASKPAAPQGQRAQLEAMSDADLTVMAKSTRMPAAAKLAAEILAERKAPAAAKTETTGDPERDQRLADLRARKAKGRGMTHADESVLARYELYVAADPAKWPVGSGVGWRVASGGRSAQINRGFRIVDVDADQKQVQIRSVADTGLTTSGGNADRIGDQWVHVGDLVRDHKYDAAQTSSQLPTSTVSVYAGGETHQAPTLRELRDKVQKYIIDNKIGSSQIGGEFPIKGHPTATKMSYNGRIWDRDGKEITEGLTPVIDAAEAANLRKRLAYMTRERDAAAERYHKLLMDKATETTRKRPLELLHALERDIAELTAKLTAADAMPHVWKRGDRAKSYQGTGEIIEIKGPDDLGMSRARLYLDKTKTYSNWINVPSLESISTEPTESQTSETPAVVAQRLWDGFTDNERHGVTFGMFPAPKMPEDVPHEVTVALMAIAAKAAKDAPPAPPTRKPYKAPKPLAPGTTVLVPNENAPVNRSWQRPATEAERAVIFAPGNIVESYIGKDKVLAYTPTSEAGSWSVKVQKTEGNEGPRSHATNPDVVKAEFRDRVKPLWVTTYTTPAAAPPASKPATSQSAQTAAKPEAGSWKAEITDGSSWASNALRFATEAEAKGSGQRTFDRWMAAKDMRVAKSDDPVTHRFIDGENVRLEDVPAPDVAAAQERIKLLTTQDRTPEEQARLDALSPEIAAARARDEQRDRETPEQAKAREDGAKIIAEMKARRAKKTDPSILNQDPPKDAAFKAWFGDSQVVDADGRPLVVYHGTGGVEIDEFKSAATLSEGNGSYSSGLYFTRKHALADSYARRREWRGQGGAIYPVYLSIQNPKIIPDSPRRWKDRSEADHRARTSSMYLTPTDVEMYREQGFDGIINQAADEYVVFDPTQVKSATGNRGTYDRTDPNILYQDPPAYDADDIKALMALMRTYKARGLTDFGTAARQFQDDYGDGARALDRPFELAWKRFFGADERVADHLSETSETESETPTPDAGDGLHLRIFDYLNGLAASAIPKNPMTLRKQVADAIGVPVKALEDDIDALNDAVEAVWAGNLRGTLNGLPAGGDDLTAQVTAARAVEDTLPRGHRTLEKSKLQQFSTPLPIGVLAAAAAQTTGDDVVLEPTAGTGNLLAGLMPTEYGGPKVVAVELSPRRAELLTASGYDVTTADYMATPFTGANQPTVVVTNPPWGKYSTGRYGRGIALGFNPTDIAERFVSKNLRDLAEGGRLVAVMPTTMLEATSFKRWLRDNYTVRAIIKSPAGSYDTRATTIESVLLVVDKIGASGTLPAVFDATDWEAYIRAVEAIDARSPITTDGRASDAPRPDPRNRPGGRGGGGGGRGGGGRRGGRGNAPVGDGRDPELVAEDEDQGGRPPLDPERTPDGPAAEPEGAPPAILPGPSDDLRAEAAASGYFAPYTRRSAIKGQPHPKLLVEARQLAGVPYPALTVTLTPTMQRAVTAGRVSVEQAEQALAALQANSGDKPFGYLAADAVGVGKSREIAMTILGAMDRAKASGKSLRLMLTTKTRDNVEDLMDEIHYVASGKKAADGGTVPFEVYRLADDYPGARKTGNDYEPLPKNLPHAVYVVDSYNVAKYRQALVDVDLHGIVGDEVQRFTNAEAQIGGSWVNLHARIMRGVPRDEQFFAYFTATPAQKVEDYAYLYGLRLWPIDGFDEWIKLVTGSMNAEQARKLAEDTEKGSVKNIDTVINSTGADPVGGDADGHQGATTNRPTWGVGGSSAFAQRLTPAEGEQIPREWKMLGRFSARDLWRAGTTFEIHQFALDPAQTKTYNQFARLAVDIVTMAQKYGTYDKSGKKSAFGVTGMLQFAAKRIQMQPALEEAIRLAKKFQADGYQPVLSILNVSEMSPEGGHLLAAVEKINTRIIDTDPNDPDGGLTDMGEIPEALIDRARLMDAVRDLGAFANPIEMIADALGQDKVAFIIGEEAKGRRKSSLEFQRGERPYAVISGAGATGINLDQRVHTDVGPGYGKRVFLDVQYEWSAMEGLQRYGRVDRASSIAPPRLIAITSGNAAEKKFLATIANRMAALGALSKGGAESTGAAGNAMAEFEITGDDALSAARRAYGEADDATKRSFATIKSAFRDPNRNAKSPDRDDFDPYAPKADMHGGTMTDFQLPLLLMPMEQANAFWDKFIQYRDELRLESGEQESMRSTRFKGEILATADLKPNLKLYTVQNEERHRFGILVGLITPEMPRLVTLMAGARHGDVETSTTEDGYTQQSDTADLRGRRRYVTFTTADTILAGLQVPFTRIPRIAEAYGALAERPELTTAAQVLAYLKAGETVTLGVINPDNDKPWTLKMRRSDDRIVIANARMADRTLLLAHGAGYASVGNYWHVTDLEKFLERWPVPDQVDAPTTPPRGGTPPASSASSSGGGFTAQSTVIPGAKEWVDQDVTPAMKAAAAEVHRARVDIRTMFAPDTMSTESQLFAGSMRANLAAYAQKTQRARKVMKDAAKSFDALAARADKEDPAAIAEFLAFTDVMDGIAEPDTLPTALQDLAAMMRDMNKRRLRQIQRLGRLRDRSGDNYFGRIWKTDAEGNLLKRGPAGAAPGRRPLQGRGKFLRPRTWQSMREGVELGATPETWNPVEMFLLKLAEQDKWIMGRSVLQEGKQLRVAKFVRIGAEAPDGWTKYHESFGTVYGPPTVQVKEAYDKTLMEGLYDAARRLGVRHVRKVNLGGQRWGYAVGSSDVTTKVGGIEGILMHELGHILDERYGLREQWVNNKAMKLELRALADMREGGAPSPGRKRYLRKGEEKIANLLHAFLYVPDMAKKIAPNSYKAMRTLIGRHPELRPLLDLQKHGRSLEIAVNSAEQYAGGLVIRGHYYGPPDAVRILDNYLSPGWVGKHFAFDAYRQVGNFMNQVQLGLSGFHMTMTGIEAMVGKVAQGFQEATRGDYGRAALSLAEAPIATFTTLIKGQKALEALYAKDANALAITTMLDQIVQGGGGIHRDQTFKAYDNRVENLLKALRQGNVLGAGLRIPGALFELPTKFIMEWWVPRLKLGAYMDLARMELRTLGPEPTLIEVRRVLGRVQDTIDDRFGQLIYDNLFWNNTLKQVGQGAFRSLGWNTGTIRTVFGAPLGQSAQTAALVTGKPVGGYRPIRMKHTGYGPTGPNGEPGERIFEPQTEPWLTHKGAYVLALLFTLGLMGAIAQLMHGGGPPTEMRDLFYWKTGKKRPDGSDERASFPSYMKDLFAVWNHPIATLGHKLQPALNYVAELLTNEDFYGTEVYNIHDPNIEIAKDLFDHAWRTMQPFTLQSFAERTRDQGELGVSAGESMLGITPAPASIYRTKAQELMQSYLPPLHRTKEEAEQARTRRSLREAIRTGNTSTQQAIAQGGTLTSRQTANADKAAGRSPLEAGFVRLTAEQALDVYQVMTPAERSVTRPMLMQKSGLIKNAPTRDQADLWKRYRDAYALPVAAGRRP